MDRDELRRLISVRIASPSTSADAARTAATLASVGNPLALALELLRPDSLVPVLQGLDRESILTLLAAGDGPEREALRRLGLLGRDGEAVAALPEVDAALQELGAREAVRQGEDRPSRGEAAAAPLDPSGWYGPALAATTRAAALLRGLAHHPARLSRKGMVTVLSLREFALVTHDDPEATGRLARMLQLAGLAVPFSRSGGPALLCPSETAEAWLDLPQPRRWLALALALTARASTPLRRAIELSGGELGAAVERSLGEEFPLLPVAARAAAQEWAALAAQLGLSVEDQLTPTARALLRDDAAAALADAERDFPETAPGIYLQPDLSVIVPGPLSPADERALSTIAETEQLGVASTMRLSPASLGRALRAGQSVARIRELLQRLSLTGIPQPLDFLLGDLERVKPAEREEDPRGAAWLAHVAELEAEAEAEAEAETPDEEMAGMSDHDLGAGAVHETEPAIGGGHGDPSVEAETRAIDEAVERIHAAAHANPGAGELTHRLELAIRHRSPVRVTAAGPEERTFVLLPLSLASGRLRAADEAAGVERTLPVSAIISVEAA